MQWSGWFRFFLWFPILRVFFARPLGTIPNAPITIGITVPLMFQSIFSFSATSRYLFTFSLSFFFLLRRRLLKAKFTWSQVLFFSWWLTKGLVFWLRLGDPFYLKIPEKFMSFIFLDGLWFAHILFGFMVKFKSLAQFPVDHLSRPVMPSLVLFWCYVSLVSRVFTNGPGDHGSIPGRVISKTLKMVLDTSLLNTQQYKVRIEGKVGQSRERSSALPYTLV